MSKQKQGYIVTSALNNLVVASTAAIVFEQFSVLIISIISGIFISRDALSAITVIIPVTTFLEAITKLIGIGGTDVVTKAIGEHNQKLVDRIYSVDMISMTGAGLIFSLLLFVFHDRIATFLCSDPAIQSLASQYLQIYAWASVPYSLSWVCTTFLSSEGRAGESAKVTIANSLTSLALGLLFVGVFKMGISGAAYAALLSNALNAAMGLIFCSRSNLYHLVFNDLDFHNALKENIREGLPLMTDEALLTLFELSLNIIIFRTLGAEGLAVWAVGMQLYLLLLALFYGPAISIFTIGGILVGEEDYKALSILYRKMLSYLLAGTAVITLFTVLFPNLILGVYGQDMGNIELAKSALPILSLSFLPLALVYSMFSLMHTLGRLKWAVAISIGQTAFMIAVPWLFSIFCPDFIWWGFLAGIVIFVPVMFLGNNLIHRHNLDTSPVDLIPTYPINVCLQCSVKYNHSSFSKQMNKVRKFIDICEIRSRDNMKANMCIEAVAHNILCNPSGGGSKAEFDIRIVNVGQHINVSIKSAGPPFNPFKNISEFNEDNADFFVANKLTNLEYEYMFGVNIVYMKFGEDIL